MALYDTVANVVSEVSVQCGLGTVSDVFGSTDSSIIQMRELLKSVGRRLILRYPWLQTVKEHTFTTDGDTEYDLPADFSSMIDQSGWNRTNDAALHPASSQMWQYLKAVESETSIVTIFKPHHLTMELLTASSSETIAYEYRSLYWVAEDGETTPTADAPTANTDVIIIGAELVKAALKYQFLKDKGFPVDAAAEDFMQVLTDMQGHNTQAAPVLNLAGSAGEKLIDMSNAPMQGYGLILGEGGLF
jgi:hypothetical protein